MAGDEQEQLALRFQQARAVFVLTQKRWKVSARLTGTKYWSDAELRQPDPRASSDIFPPVWETRPSTTP